MLSINDIKTGTFVAIDGDPYEFLGVNHQHIGRGGSSVQTKIKNLRTGQLYDRNYKPADGFDEADIEKRKVKFLYSHRGEHWFSDVNNPKDRFSLREEKIGEQAKFLKPNIEVIALAFSSEDGESSVVNITLPIKIDYKVIEAPPAVRGDTAQGGVKQITLECDVQVTAPLFINEGDIVRVNTETGQYVERVEKG